MILNFIIQHIDWIAGPFGLVGMYLLSQKNKWGWIGLLCCSIGFGIIGVVHGLYGLIITSVIYGLIEIRGFIRYHADNSYVEQSPICEVIDCYFKNGRCVVCGRTLN